MKVAMLEVGHWHTPMYLTAVRELTDHEIVAVSDKQLELAGKRAEAFECRAYESSEEMLDEEKPDFVFIFGEHVEMPALMELALARDIPFCVEKPCAVTAEALRPLAKRVKQAGLFNAVCYCYRVAPLTKLLVEWRDRDLLGKLTSLSFRYLTGPPQRYVNWNCAWMLEPDRCGGGTTLNLSGHYIDLLRYLTGDEFAEAHGWFSADVFGEKIEDHSHIFLRTTGGAIGLVETGYTGAGNPNDKDLFQLMSEKREMVFNGTTNQLKWWDRDGNEGVEQMPAVQIRSVFVDVVLKACESGNAPPADLDDALAVLEAIDRAADQ